MIEIYLYGAKWCIACEQEKAWLESKNIQFSYHDVDDDEVKRFLSNLQVTSVPFTIIKNKSKVEYVYDFNPAKIMESINNVR